MEEQNPPVEEYIIKGLESIDLENYHEAIDNFSNAIEITPNDYRLYFGRGIAYDKLKEYSSAILEYSKSIELNSLSALAFQNRGFIYAKSLKEYDKAILDYTKAIEIEPENEEIYLSRGNVYDDLKDYSKAILDFTKAIELKPEFANAYFNRGNVYYALRDYSIAVLDYNKVIEFKPKDAEAFLCRGLAYNFLENINNAYDDLRKAESLGNQKAKEVLVQIHTNMGNSTLSFVDFFDKGNEELKLCNYSEAIKLFSKAIEINPNITEAYNNRGIAYDKLKEFDNALADYSKALIINPNYAESYLNRGIMYHDMKCYYDAILDFSRAIDVNPNYIAAYYNLGNIYALIDDHPKALSNYDKTIELDPNYGDAYFNRASIYVIQKNMEKAYKDWDKADSLGVPKAKDMLILYNRKKQKGVDVICSNVKFDGIYQTKSLNNHFYYLRFYSDNTVISVRSTDGIEEIFKWFDRDSDKIEGHGIYEIINHNINFIISSDSAKVAYIGYIIMESEIKFSTNCLHNGVKSVRTYYFKKHHSVDNILYNPENNNSVSNYDNNMKNINVSESITPTNIPTITTPLKVTNTIQTKPTTVQNPTTPIKPSSLQESALPNLTAQNTANSKKDKTPIYVLFIVALILIILYLFVFNKDSNNNKISNVTTASEDIKKNGYNSKETDPQQEKALEKQRGLQSNLKTPDGVVVKFIQSLGKQDWSVAFGLMTEKRRGNFNNFKSTKGYGGITRTYIYSCEYTGENNGKKEVKVDYESIDPSNKNGRFKQYYYLTPFNDSFLIAEIKNINIEWY